MTTKLVNYQSIAEPLRNAPMKQFNTTPRGPNSLIFTVFLGLGMCIGTIDDSRLVKLSKVDEMEANSDFT